MASDISKYLGNKICRWLAGNAMPTAPTTLYLALFDGDPKSTGTEVTEDVNSAGRVAIDLDAIADDGTDVLLTSDADADFGASEADVSISHLAVFDASSAGNMLFSKAATGGPFAVTTGSNVKAPSGDLTFTVGS